MTHRPEPDETAKATGLLKRLKSAELSLAPTSLWVLHRKLKDGKADYKIKRVNIDQKVEKKLAGILSSHVNEANQIEPYAFESTDQDERIFFHSIAGTDFEEILPIIMQGSDAPVIANLNELSGAWATLIVSHKFEDDPVVAFRRAPEGWNTKRLDCFFNVAFSNQQLISLDETSVLRIDQKVDFIGFQDQIFILSKKSFEAGLNFRTGMESKRDQLIDRMEEMKVFNNVKLLAETCGSNMHYLRKFCIIEESGYYKNADFLARLKKANDAHGWGLVFDGDNLCITAETIATVITVLSNRRVQSMVNEERFDVEGSLTPLK